MSLPCCMQPSAGNKLVAVSSYRRQSWRLWKQALKDMDLGGVRVALSLLHHVPCFSSMLWLRVIAWKVCDQEHT